MTDNNTGLSEKLYTKELYDLCKIKECVPDGKKKYEIKEIQNCLYAMDEYLMKAFLIAWPNEEPLVRLTGIEIASAVMCSHSMVRKDWKTAIKELAECIYDRGDGVDPDRLMNYAEHTVYLLLISNFLNVLEYQYPIKKSRGMLISNILNSFKARKNARNIMSSYLSNPEDYMLITRNSETGYLKKTNKGIKKKEEERT